MCVFPVIMCVFVCVFPVCENMDTYHRLLIGLVLILGLILCGFTRSIYNVFV